MKHNHINIGIARLPKKPLALLMLPFIIFCFAVWFVIAIFTTLFTEIFYLFEEPLDAYRRWAYDEE